MMKFSEYMLIAALGVGCLGYMYDNIVCAIGAACYLGLFFICEVFGK